MTILNSQERELLACNKFQEFIACELQFRCLKNPSYSLRAFARDMNLSVSALSTIIRGLKTPTLASIEKISLHLQRPDPVCAYFKYLSLSQISTDVGASAKAWDQARAIRLEFLYSSIETHHQTIEQWDLATFALALLLRIKGEDQDELTLAARLGVTLEKLQTMIADLEREGWLERTATGLVSHVRFQEMGDQGAAYHIRSVHRRNLEYALLSLEGSAMEARRFYSAYFTMSQAKFEEISRKMREFVLSIGEDANQSPGDQEVYALGTFLVPLTVRSER